MKIIWVRGAQDIPVNRPHTDFVVSPIRGGGKSSYLESRAMTYLKHGNTIIDFFGSRDSEGLAWGRCPMIDGVGPANGEKRMALLHSDNVTVDAPFDTIPMSKLNHSTLKKYDVLVSASALHKSLDDEYQNVNVITDLLYDRGVKGYDKLCVGVIREASNLYYSRLRVSTNQTQAKAYMIYLIREARHMGLALVMDTLKMTSIDIDIRVLVDNTIFKGQGYLGLPDDLTFIYRYFEPDWIRNMKPWEFVILTKEGSLGLGVFKEVKWHKQEKENILHELGIKIIEHEGMVQSKAMGRGMSVSDEEHVTIVETTASERIRKQYGVSIEKKGIKELSKIMSRSYNTLKEHVLLHDDNVARFGYCPMCRRAGGLLYKILLVKFELQEAADKALAESTIR